ncbi:hypothetical protein EB1_12300 [Empedobacter brevis NBRC 14943 = ATCC 43319]|uniref:Uncharacterized protein n=1 Tax=Empedobacter brevis NBRC 14943 = ATCC 43319 TaxID=1218108 RepID=A0A511NF30_9FLAO|nr:hypothetical protein EB1_12300 [Empedobacter brevis NBRC 14943 = ATCC 43319]
MAAFLPVDDGKLLIKLFFINGANKENRDLKNDSSSRMGIKIFSIFYKEVVIVLSIE